jgi:ribonuclease BN (tRNA processing enzyme)
VTVLGSGDAYGSGGRLHSAYLVQAPERIILLDCGPTILQALKRAGHSPGAVDMVVISHHHGDHFGGIPFLYLEYLYESPRTRPLTVCGPPGTEARVRTLFTALYEHSARQPLPFPVRYQELVPGTPRDIDGVRLAPFAVPHTPDLVAFGYRLEVAGRTILYSGDSASSASARPTRPASTSTSPIPRSRRACASSAAAA